MLVRLSRGSYGICNWTVGKESRSVCTAAARNSCERRANPQDCLKTAEKKSQTLLRLARYGRLPCECLTLSVRSSNDLDPKEV